MHNRHAVARENPESRDSGFDAEPVIGPRFARTRWHRPVMTASGIFVALRLATTESPFGLFRRPGEGRDPYPPMLAVDGIAAPALHNMNIGGYGSRIALRLSWTTKEFVAR